MIPELILFIIFLAYEPSVQSVFFLPWKSDLQNPVIVFYFISHLSICKSL